MKPWPLWACLFLISCGNEPEEKPGVAATVQTTTQASQASAAMRGDTAAEADTVTEVVAAPPPEVKKPSGIYQFVLPYDANTKILHTVAFYPGTFRLQEEYLNKADSLVLTEGTWAPSQGAIWLYKEQLVRGRYFWKGDTLQYFSPRLNKRFSMVKLTPAGQNAVWQEKKKEATFYGVGTEPFWSVEVSRQDSLVINMPDWTAPLRVKITDAVDNNGRKIYRSLTDSLEVTILPYFCTDGMSDFIYANKVLLNYKGKRYKGCGVVF